MVSPPNCSDTVRTAREFSALRKHEVVDYSGTTESMLPISEASVVQLQPGPAPTNLEVFSSDKICVLGLRHHTASVGVVVMKADCFGFMWWDGTEECRINGQVARRTQIYTQGKQDGFHAAGGARQTMGIGVRRNELVETLATLRGVGPEDVLLDRAALELSPEDAIRFRYGINGILRETSGPKPGRSADVGAVDPSEAIFGLLIDAYLRTPLVRHRDDRPRQPELIVRRAEERFFASQSASISLADLCAATGVSQSALYRAFDAVCGEPPIAYFHKRRLTEARRLLTNSPAYRGAVKHTALAAGFTEFGRFSVDYRQLFGESPSATLNRNVAS